MRRFLRSLIWLAGIVAVVGVGLNATLVDVWTVPADDRTLVASIAPTLAGGDTVLMLKRGTPGFGDLVRCVDPENDRDFIIGRIVGQSNDLVETEGTMLRINGRRYDSESSCPDPVSRVRHPMTGLDVDLTCEVETLGGGWHFRGVIRKKTNRAAPTRTTVGSGMLFLLSDNREMHDDSRDFGVVPAASCSRRIIFRAWGSAGWNDSKTRLTYIR